MNKDTVRTDIAKSWFFAKSLGVAEVFSNPVPIVPSTEFLDAALDPDAHYEDIYLTGLGNNDYNILLSDYAFLQFGLTKDDHVRYAYYPNPFLGASSEAISELRELREYVAEGIISVEDYLHRASELRKSQHPPLIRYENSPEQYKEFNHPCSHFHLGHHSGNRWPSQRILTPLAFSLVVVRQFYSDVWFSAGTLKLFEHELLPDDFLAQAKSECRILPDELFSKSERAVFFFA